MSQDCDQQMSRVRNAFEDVAQSGRQLVVNQLALVGAEAKEGLDGAVNRLIEALMAILLGFCGFVVLTVAAVRQLEIHVGQPIACAIIGGSYILVAILLARASAGKRNLPGKGS